MKKDLIYIMLRWEKVESMKEMHKFQRNYIKNITIFFWPIVMRNVTIEMTDSLC